MERRSCLVETYIEAEGMAWSKQVVDEVGGWDRFGSFEGFREGMDFK